MSLSRFVSMISRNSTSTMLEDVSSKNKNDASSEFLSPNF